MHYDVLGISLIINLQTEHSTSVPRLLNDLFFMCVLIRLSTLSFPLVWPSYHVSDMKCIDVCMFLTIVLGLIFVSMCATTYVWVPSRAK